MSDSNKSNLRYYSKILYACLFLASSFTTYQGLTQYSILGDAPNFMYGFIVLSVTIGFFLLVSYIQDHGHELKCKLGLVWYILINIFILVFIFISSTIYSAVFISGSEPTNREMQRISITLSHLVRTLGNEMDIYESLNNDFAIYSKNAHKRADREEEAYGEGPHHEINIMLHNHLSSAGQTFKRVIRNNEKRFNEIKKDLSKLISHKNKIAGNEPSSATEGAIHRDSQPLNFIQYQNQFITLLEDIKNEINSLDFILTESFLNQRITEIESDAANIPMVLERAKLNRVNLSPKELANYIARIEQTQTDCEKIISYLNSLKLQPEKREKIIEEIGALRLRSANVLVFTYFDLKAFGMAMALDFIPFFLAYLLSIISAGTIDHRSVELTFQNN